MSKNYTKQERIWSGIVWKHVILLWTSAPSYALAHNYCYCHAYLSSSRFNFSLLWCHIRKEKIWKNFRRRGLAVRWKMFWKIIINIWYISRSKKLWFSDVSLDPYTSIAVNFYVHVRAPLKGKFPQTIIWIGWVESHFRNPTVKFWANFDNPFKRTNYAKFCMSPSLDRTLPEYVTPYKRGTTLHQLCT